MSVMRHPQITKRQREILLKTLELYISTGSPVGSHALAEQVDASSSTIRAELATLESLGLLTHPHTSAGRVPTDAGYRYYVDALLAEGVGERYPLETSEDHRSLDELLRDVSESMSEVTRLLAVVAGPGALGDPVVRIDYLPLPERSLLLIISTESGASSSTTMTLPREVAEEELQEMFATLNAWLEGRPVGGNLELSTVARRLQAGHDPRLVEVVLEAIEALGRTSERGVFVRGASALLARLDELEPSSLAAVVEIFERRRWLLRLMSDALQRSLAAKTGIFVSIGAENVFRSLGGTSLVAAAYSHHERPYGVVSLIGPKRMNYDAAISTVRSAADTLTHYLNARL